MRVMNRQPILTNFEKQRLSEVGSIIAEGVDPISVTVSSMGGEFKMTYKDLANYYEHHGIPFSLVVSCFRTEGEGKNVKRFLS